jgi:hypothetical protein
MHPPGIYCGGSNAELLNSSTKDGSPSHTMNEGQTGPVPENWPSLDRRTTSGGRAWGAGVTRNTRRFFDFGDIEKA